MDIIIVLVVIALVIFTTINFKSAAKDKEKAQQQRCHIATVGGVEVKLP
ncbi:hypothetical protein [Phascolarctobacterium sp.]